MASRVLAALLPLSCLALPGCSGDGPTVPPRAECVAPGGMEALDLVVGARLHAQATRAPSAPPYPHESLDAIATVRDDAPDTCWKVPPEATTDVTIDLQPWLDRSVVLDQLGLGFAGTPPTAVSVRVGETCDDDDPWEGTAAVDGNTELARCGGCVLLRVTAGPATDTCLARLSLTTRDASVTPPPLVPTLAPTGLPPAPTSGVIEGFYGVPWTWRERHRMVATLGRHGLGFYLYAPKEDPLHRERWREPYPAADQEQFRLLAERAAAAGVELSLGMSPFLDWDGTSEPDYQVLLAKLTVFLGLGVHSFGLLADDIDLGTSIEPDGALGAAHVAVANRLLTDLRAVEPGARLVFVPTVYNDQQALPAPAQEYLAALAALDADIPVMWTGTRVFTDTLAASDLAAVTAAAGRPPLLWDNHWANDAGDGISGRLLLAPLLGRSADLPAASHGLAFNLSIQGALSRVVLGTAARYLADPAGYDPGAALSAAARDEGGFWADQADATPCAECRERDAALLERVLRVFAARNTDTPHFEPLDIALAALGARLDAGERAPTAAVEEVLGAAVLLRGLRSELHHSTLAAELVDELDFPLRRVELEAEITLAALDALDAGGAGHDPAAALAAGRAAVEAGASVRHRHGDGGPLRLLEQVAALAPGSAGVVRPSPDGALPPCRVGAPWRWQAFREAASAGAQLALLVGGLPGATTEEGAVVFTPRHAGSYTVVVGATRRAGAPGWAVVELTLRCTTR